MSYSAVPLLSKTLKELQGKSNVGGVTVCLVDDSNVFEWSLCFLGPAGTPYAGGLFNAVMNFPQEYPNLVRYFCRMQ